MTDKISRFPVSTWQRIVNRRGNRAVSCIVSSRYLVFSEKGSTSTGYYPDTQRETTPVTVDVMTDTFDDEKGPRKLCQIILTLEDLRRMVSMLEQE